PAAAAGRPPAQDLVRDPGRDEAAAHRAVHHRLPGGDLPAVHRAEPARGVRLRGHPGEGDDAHPREEEVRRPPLAPPPLAPPPPRRGGPHPKILFAPQAGTRPPHIVLFTPGFLEEPSRRFIERSLRGEFGFEGTPVKVTMRTREKKKSGARR